MNVQASDAVLARLRRYADPFESLRPPVFDHFPGGAEPLFPFEPESDRGLAVLLLTAALHRPGGETAAAAVLGGLYRRYGNDIFKLNRLPFEPLRAVIAECAPSMEASERERIPGILRSVCDFFYRTGPLGPWLSAAPDWESRAEEISREVYWMGAHSRTRNKARYFLWLACLTPDFAARHPQSLAFAWPVSAGHMRFWLELLKPARIAGARAGVRTGGRTPEERIAGFAAFARTVFPAAPWRLFQPLDAYLRRTPAGGLACRDAQGECRRCPFSDACPGASLHLSREGE